MKVYAAVEVDDAYCEYSESVRKVFDTEEKADKYCKRMTKESAFPYEVRIWEVE